MIDVRLYANLVEYAGKTPGRLAGSAGFSMAAREGLTVRDAVAEAGIPPESVHIAMVNNARVDLDSSLEDGDRLSLFPAVSGG